MQYISILISQVLLTGKFNSNRSQHGANVMEIYTNYIHVHHGTTLCLITCNFNLFFFFVFYDKKYKIEQDVYTYVFIK